MTMRRRDFLRSLLTTAAAALAGHGLGRRPAFAQPMPMPAPKARRFSLGLLLDPGTPEGRGAALGLDEARRVGELLHVEISSGPTSEFVLIGAAPPQRETKALFLAAVPGASAPEPAWNVTASPAFRQQALARHADRKDLRAVDWHPGLMKFGAEELNVRFHRRFDQPMDERSWHGWVAVKCAVELALRYPGGNPKERIGELRLDGHKGMMLRFDSQDRHLVQPVYLVDAEGRMVEAVEPEWKE
jgi:hypothetical protein